jgi:hypothetical protein
MLALPSVKKTGNIHVPSAIPARRGQGFPATAIHHVRARAERAPVQLHVNDGLFQLPIPGDEYPHWEKSRLVDGEQWKLWRNIVKSQVRPSPSLTHQLEQTKEAWPVERLKRSLIFIFSSDEYFSCLAKGYADKPPARFAAILRRCKYLTTTQAPAAPIRRQFG